MPTDPAPLPAWLAELIDRPRAKVRHAPSAVELDTPIAVEAAIATIKRWELAGGIDEPSNTYPKAARLKDLGISAERAVELMMTWWCPHFDIEWLTELVDHVWSYGQNDAGSDRPKPDAEAFAKAATVACIAPKSRLRLAQKGMAAPVQWLWPGWLARGMFHILAGDPGTGKSTLACKLAAMLSRGGKWPDGTPCPRGNTLIWSSEDPWKFVIEPRLLASQADLARIDAIEGVTDAEGAEKAFDPARDLTALLDHAFQVPDLRLMILDPIVSAVTGDDNQNNVVRRALAPLVDFADRRGITILGISHYTKNSEGRSPLDRVMGSRGYGALARVVLAAAATEDRKRRILVRAKSNIGPDGDGFNYLVPQSQIENNGETFKAQSVEWGSALTGPARELLNQVAPQKTDRKIDKARALILATIQSGGGVARTPVLKIAAEEAGISWGTMRDARDALDALITVRHCGNGEFEWRNVTPLAPDGQPW